MSTLKHLRTRIKSVTSTQKITAAMKMVAAAKFKRAQTSAENAKPFVNEVTKLTTKTLHISKSNDLLVSGSDAPPIIILYAADRGLCGGFNSFMFKEFKNHTKNLDKFYCIGIGKRAIQFLNKSYSQHLLNDLTPPPHFDFLEAKTLSDKLATLIQSKVVGKVDIIYTTFKNVITLIPTVKAVIPLKLSLDHLSEDPIFEPKIDVLLPNILNLYLNTVLYSAFLESNASEQAARMTAMDNATKNATDMVNRLKLTYNRTRQANITRELIEIISGAQASL